ncbi:glycosyltransferase [Pontibacter anaerobius]|uniref:Glycosyltransferase n=1 Tax=Pontibacter anaerobius TaxID=2993940 RepID=A0ABT3RET1_9BACT|nr:glycosyltransferase [Pontibacter anaerobius]MCX2739941.1 glycosyltransferase [Pontibacter anaerobius]
MTNRICFFPGTLSLGGIGKLFVNLIEEYASRGIGVDVFLTKKEGEFLEQLPASVRVFEGGGRALNSMLLFIKYLNKEKPDAVISAREYLNIVNILCCALSFSKARAVVSLHTNQTAENAAGHARFKNNYHSSRLMVFAKLLYRLSPKIVAVSRGVADDFSQRMSVERKKIEVIYNPVYKPYSGECSAVDNDFNAFIKTGRKYIVGVGRLTEQKDFATLIRALSMVRKEKDIALVILGEGALRQQLEELVEELGLADHVLMPGFVKDPLCYVSRASALVVSSEFEGFGNVIVESLGVGTPVISTNCPSGPSEILEDGKYGALVPVKKPEAMAKAILGTINFPPEPSILIDRAKEFAVPHIADQYLSYIYS